MQAMKNWMEGRGGWKVDWRIEYFVLGKTIFMIIAKSQKKRKRKKQVRFFLPCFFLIPLLLPTPKKKKLSLSRYSLHFSRVTSKTRIHPMELAAFFSCSFGNVSGVIGF